MDGMTQTTANRPRGRPRLAEGAMLDRINIRVPSKVMAALHRIRDRRDDGADTAQVIREVLSSRLRELGELDQ